MSTSHIKSISIVCLSDLQNMTCRILARPVHGLLLRCKHWPVLQQPVPAVAHVRCSHGAVHAQHISSSYKQLRAAAGARAACLQSASSAGFRALFQHRTASLNCRWACVPFVISSLLAAAWGFSQPFHSQHLISTLWGLCVSPLPLTLQE